MSAVALLDPDPLCSLGEAVAAHPVPVPRENGMVQESGDGCGDISSPPESNPGDSDVLGGGDPRMIPQSRGICVRV